MPQFDKVTFFNQIFWFLIAFFSFYFFILKGLLPVLAASLKTRKKLVLTILAAGQANSENSFKKSYFKNLQKFLKTHKALFSSFTQKKLLTFKNSKTSVFARNLVS